MGPYTPNKDIELSKHFFGGGILCWDEMIHPIFKAQTLSVRSAGVLGQNENNNSNKQKGRHTVIHCLNWGQAEEEKEAPFSFFSMPIFV